MIETCTHPSQFSWMDRASQFLEEHRFRLRGRRNDGDNGGNEGIVRDLKCHFLAVRPNFIT